MDKEQLHRITDLNGSQFVKYLSAVNEIVILPHWSDYYLKVVPNELGFIAQYHKVPYTILPPRSQYNGSGLPRMLLSVYNEETCTKPPTAEEWLQAYHTEVADNDAIADAIKQPHLDRDVTLLKYFYEFARLHVQFALSQNKNTGGSQPTERPLDL